MIIFYIILGWAIGFGLCYIALIRPRQILNQKIASENEKLNQKYINLTASIASAETEVSALEKQKKSLNQDIENINSQAASAAEAIYENSYNLMQEKLSQSAELAGQKYQQAEQEYQKEYLSTLAETSQEFSDQITNYQLQINEYENVIVDLQDKINAAIEAEKRKILDDDKKQYYQIIIPEEDKEDIQLLKEVIKKLNKDPEPVNKIIWELYYKKPTLDLLGRITPTGTNHIGIYKITNLKTNKCYIGQSLNLRNRIRDHIKAGLGISSSNNRFYSEMKNKGPESFSYEILEECDKNKLNERERFWIDFYSSQNWGYNVMKGIENEKDS